MSPSRSSIATFKTRMKAMILAAGRGVRLRPLTDRVPKALIEVGGIPMVEIVIKRLVAAGVTGAAVNLWHLGDQVEAFIKERKGFGIDVRFFREEPLLDTGGGIKNAAGFLADSEPFFVHNADVLSEIDLNALYRAHGKSGALATLAVSDRPGPRRLLFDGEGRLIGREEAGRVLPRGTRAMAFNGIHVLSPEIFAKMPETGVFSIITSYLRLAKEGEKLLAYDAGAARWLDIGTPESLKKARAWWGIARQGPSQA